MEAMATVTDIGSAISRTPGICGGRPCIAGTRVSVLRIAIMHHMGTSPEEIARRISHLSLAQVQSALTWYFANKLEIDQDIADEKREATALEAMHRR
jgi:uncharacterized protein (DUF433 family)